VQGQLQTVITEELIAPYNPSCPQCGSAEQIVQDFNQGHMVCSECGVVVSDRIIAEGTEWRTFSDSSSKGSDPNRVGGPESSLMENVGLSTIIGSSEGGNQNWSLTRYQNHGAMHSAHRSLFSAFHRIDNLASRLSMPQNLADRCKELYKRIDESKDLKGRKIEAIIAACLFIVCRQEGVPRTFKEMSEVSEVTRKEISRCFSRIIKLKIYKKPKLRVDDGQTGPAQLMERFCSVLKLPQALTNVATYVAAQSQKLAIAEGKNPATIAGGAIALVCQMQPNEAHKRHDIGSVVRMSESTIRGVLKTMYDRRFEILPSDFVSNPIFSGVKSSAIAV